MLEGVDDPSRRELGQGQGRTAQKSSSPGRGRRRTPAGPEPQGEDVGTRTQVGLPGVLGVTPKKTPFGKDVEDVEVEGSSIQKSHHDGRQQNGTRRSPCQDDYGVAEVLEDITESFRKWLDPGEDPGRERPSRSEELERKIRAGTIALCGLGRLRRKEAKSIIRSLAGPREEFLGAVEWFSLFEGGRRLLARADGAFAPLEIRLGLSRRAFRSLLEVLSEKREGEREREEEEEGRREAWRIGLWAFLESAGRRENVRYSSESRELFGFRHGVDLEQEGDFPPTARIGDLGYAGGLLLLESLLDWDSETGREANFWPYWARCDSDPGRIPVSSSDQAEALERTESRTRASRAPQGAPARESQGVPDSSRRVSGSARTAREPGPESERARERERRQRRKRGQGSKRGEAREGGPL